MDDTKCKLCGKDFGTPEALEAHMEQAGDPEPKYLIGTTVGLPNDRSYIVVKHDIRFSVSGNKHYVLYTLERDPSLKDDGRQKRQLSQASIDEYILAKDTEVKITDEIIYRKEWKINFRLIRHQKPDGKYDSELYVSLFWKYKRLWRHAPTPLIWIVYHHPVSWNQQKMLSRLAVKIYNETTARELLALIKTKLEQINQSESEACRPPVMK